MLKRLQMITTLLFVLSTLPAWAAPVYVSAGTQIFSINGGVATPLTDLGTGHHPQDLVVGPDGNLYVADFDDSGNSRIYRVVCPTLTSCSSTPIATLSGSPQGLAFSGSDNFDLWVSTLTGSLWKVTNAVGALPQPPCGNVVPCFPPTAATQVLFGPNNNISFNNGAGVAFGPTGRLLVAKNTNSGGVSYLPPPGYNSINSFPGTLKNPIGVTVTNCAG